MTTEPRVVHINDVAGVATAAVTQATHDGLPWRLWPLPSVRGRSLPGKLWVRAVDLWRFRAAARSADLLHVHFGHFAYYAWFARRRYVLHLHGTDVNQNLSRKFLGRLTRRAIRRAAAVVYSTPDLTDAVRALRADARWLPAPLHPEVFAEPAGAALDAALRADPASGEAPAEAIRVVFASRWDEVKGLPQLLDVAERLRAGARPVDLIGIDWGAGRAAAAAAGVRLLPLLSAAEFRELLRSADVVLGQLASGALGVADLTAMALARPLVARFTGLAAYGGDEPTLWNTVEIDPVVAVDQIAGMGPDERARLGDAARQWALRHHSAEAFVVAARELYRRMVR